MAEKKPFFTNPDTESRFEAPMGVDKTINVPGKYSGLLSEITPDVAEALIKMEDNQVSARKKPLAPAAAESK